MVFKQKNFGCTRTPPPAPYMANAIKNFHFFWKPFPYLGRSYKTQVFLSCLQMQTPASFLSMISFHPWQCFQTSVGSGMFLRIPTLLPWWPKFPPPPPPDHNADFLPDFLHFYFLFHICPIFTLHQSQRSAKITIAVKASTWSGQHGLKMLCKTTK